uniref:Myotubularin-related protein 9 n=1 Tax=Ornithorhynchus anatinus TaxID=9258 RepID=A0A6I8N306_ORNAN
MEFAELIKTPRADNVVLHRPLYPAVEGTLCLTGHHLILSSRQDNTEELWLLHANIDSIDKRFVGSLGTIVVKCKDLRVIRLDVPGMDECLNIASSIEALSTLGSVTLMYPFFYRPMFEVGEDGWQAFLPQQEFERVSSVTGDWRLSHVNKDFSVCPSYPALVTVPAAVDDEALRKAAQFRHGGRFPVLSYYHKKNGMVMMRSGQPLTGTNGRRCKEDEKLVNATLRPGKRGYIIDTRALNVAQQARAKGGGFEQEAHYPQWRRIHKAVERYPILQESLIKLVEACNDQSHNMDRWLSKLEASNWLTHVKEILTTACLAAQCLDREGASVLVHGTEGTDSTLQVTSLAQILLDPRCRTLRGFQALVEREWLQVSRPGSRGDPRGARRGRREAAAGGPGPGRAPWPPTGPGSAASSTGRPGTRSSSAAPRGPTPAASRSGRRPCSSCSWTACGRSCASSPAPSSSPSTSSSCSWSTPTPPSSGPSWATTRARGGGCRSPASNRGRPAAAPAPAAEPALSPARSKLKLPQKTMSLWSWVNRPAELAKFTNPLFEANGLVIWPSVAPQSLQLWEGEDPTSPGPPPLPAARGRPRSEKTPGEGTPVTFTPAPPPGLPYPPRQARGATDAGDAAAPSPPVPSPGPCPVERGWGRGGRRALKAPRPGVGRGGRRRRGVPALDPVLQVPGRSLRRDGCHHPVQQGAAGQGQRPAPATGPAGDRGQGAGEPLRCLPRPPPPSPASPRPLTLTLSRRGPHGPSAGSDLPARSPRHVQRLSPPPPRVSPLLRGGGGVPSGCPGGRGRPPEPGPVGTGGSGPWVSAPLPLLGSGSRTGTGPGSGPLLPSAPCPPLPPRAVGRKPGILGSLCRPQGPSEGPVGAT